MDIRDLNYFLAVCKAGSFAAGARDSNIVPTTMSHAIARLEDSLGVSLFDRSRDGVTLTGQGAELLRTAPAVLAAVQSADDAVAAAGGQVRGTVTLGTTLHTGRLDLAAVFSGVRSRHPGVVIQLRQSQAGSAGLIHAVRDGSLDIALTASTRAPDGIALHRLFSEPILYICGAGHRLARRSPVTVRDLRQETILRPPPGWGTRAVIDEVLGPTRCAHEVCNYALMADLVRSGFGTALAPASALGGDTLAGLRAVPVEDPRLRWTLSAAVCTPRNAAAATRILLDALIQQSAERPQELSPPAAS